MSGEQEEGQGLGADDVGSRPPCQQGLWGKRVGSRKKDRDWELTMWALAPLVSRGYGENEWGAGRRTGIGS